MKQIFNIFVLFFFLFSAPVFASYTCSKGCDSQCKVGFLGNNVEPVCYSGCKVWQLAKCYDISDPYVSSMGEFGQNAYVASAATMQARNPIWSALDEHEKEILHPFFGALVGKIRLHLKANLMDRWGDDPYQIRLGDSSGQTYGHDVYIRYYRTDLDRVDRIILIGHELCHARQYEARGSSLHKFGRDYFEGFAKSGGYANNPMEKECENLEGKLQDAADKYWAYYDEHKRPWNFETCNNSDYETIYVALGWPHKLDGGFSLVPMRTSKGWFAVKKGECKILQHNIKSDEGFDAYATAGAAGNWATWSSPNGPGYCIHPTKAFEIGEHYNCDAANGEEKAHFRSIENSWRKYGSGTYKWNLTGNATNLKICNNSGKAVDAAILRGDRTEWRSEGWFTFAIGQCRDWNFGAYTGKLFIYGENNTTGDKWQDLSKPGMCVYSGTVFEHPSSTTCFTGSGGKIAYGYETNLTAGQNQWNFQP